MKLFTQIVFLMTSITDLMFGDLYGHFKTENISFLSLLPWGATEQV